MMIGSSHGGHGLGATVYDFAQAIKKNEGWYPGSRSYRNNNPGNLMALPGQPADAQGFRVFSSPAEGEAALENQIRVNIGRGLTLDEFFTGKTGVYSGYDKTDPAYASKMAASLGIDPGAVLSQTIGAAPATPAPVIAWDEQPAPTTVDMYDPNRRLNVPYDQWDQTAATDSTGVPAQAGVLPGGLSTGTMLLLAGVGVLGIIALNNR